MAILRDFVPEGKEKEFGPVRSGRDFIPEGGLSQAEERIPIPDPADAKRQKVPEQAPLLEKDFIHSAEVSEVKTLPERVPAPPAKEEAPPAKADEPEPEPEFVVPEGYVQTGVDDDGNPILRRKGGRPAKPKAETEEEGKKGGYVAPGGRSK